MTKDLTYIGTVLQIVLFKNPINLDKQFAQSVWILNHTAADLVKIYIPKKRT